MRRDGYGDYLKKLEAASGIAITDLAAYKKAISARLDYFVENGCCFTDVGIADFPDAVAEEDAAARTFAKLLAGGAAGDGEYRALLGNLYVFLSGLYRERNLIQQLHLAVQRNLNTRLFRTLGPDCGVDSVGDAVCGGDLAGILDAMDQNGGLPETIVYTLNPANAEQIASIAGAFPHVHCGAAWWFCDHKRGIREELEIIAENGVLGTFYGMLTDSRSFLSYARHDYFRRILCSLVGEWVERGEFCEESAEKLVKKISYETIQKAVGERQ